jgi:hypothetical protein
MAYILGKIKCCFCGNVDGEITSVPKYGIYEEVGHRTFFHDECLEAIQLEPEKYGHKIVDIAIDIQDRLKDAKAMNKRIISKWKEHIEKLHQGHIERMMPKQF